MGRHSEGLKLVKFPWSEYLYITGSQAGRSFRKSTGETDRGLAQKVLADTILALGKDEATEDSHTVGEIIDIYIMEHLIKKPTYQKMRYQIDALKAEFGVYVPAKLNPTSIRAFSGKEAKRGIKPGTTRRVLGILTSALNYMHNEGKLTIVPPIPLPDPSPAKERWLTKAEARKLIAACENLHMKLFVAIALYTGQRKGAILDLQWPQVDLKSKVKTINFNPPGRAETKKKRVLVPINDELVALLRQVQKKTGHVISYMNRGNGGRLGDIRKGFQEACERAKLVGVTPHTLKHTCGTWLAQAGVDMWRISGLLGHSHSRTTQIYLKYSPEYLKGAVGKISLAQNLRTKGKKQGQNG